MSLQEIVTFAVKQDQVQGGLKEAEIVVLHRAVETAAWMWKVSYNGHRFDVPISWDTWMRQTGPAIVTLIKEKVKVAHRIERMVGKR